MLPNGTKEAHVHTSTALEMGVRIIVHEIGAPSTMARTIVAEPEMLHGAGATAYWLMLADEAGAVERWLVRQLPSGPITPTRDNLPWDTAPKSVEEMEHDLSTFADEIRDVVSRRQASLEEALAWMRRVVQDWPGHRFLPVWEKENGRLVALLPLQGRTASNR